MKYYLKFTSNGDYHHGEKRCDLAISENGRITMTHGFSFAEHVTEAATEAEAIAHFSLTPHITPALTPRQALDRAHATGIEVTSQGTTYRLKCAKEDQAAFTGRTTLFLQVEAGLTAAQKTAFRANTPTSITDAHGTAHTMTVGAFQQLIIAYGMAYDALWTAAVSSPAATPV